MSRLQSTTDKIGIAVQLAQAIDDGNGSGERIDEVIADAQLQRVTLFDVLRSHLLLSATNGNAAIVGAWLSVPETAADNLSSKRLDRRGKRNHEKH